MHGYALHPASASACNVDVTAFLSSADGIVYYSVHRAERVAAKF